MEECDRNTLRSLGKYVAGILRPKPTAPTPTPATAHEATPPTTTGPTPIGIRRALELLVVVSNSDRELLHHLTKISTMVEADFLDAVADSTEPDSKPLATVALQVAENMLEAGRIATTIAAAIQCRGMTIVKKNRTNKASQDARS